MSSLGVLVVAVLSATAAVPATVPSAPPAPPPPPPAGQPSRGLVIVLRPADVDQRTRTALARVTGELTAARFRVSVFGLDPNLDPTHQVETVAPDSNAVAAFAIGHPADSGPDIVAIWVCDRLGRRTTIQRMAMHGDDMSKDAEALAVEAIELIRVSIAGLWPNPVHGGTLDASLPQEPPTLPPATGKQPIEFGVGLGLAMFRDPGLGTSHWMGTLDASVTWPTGLGLQLTLAGLSTTETIATPDGGAAIRHQLGSVGPTWTFWTGTQARLWMALGLGFDHVSADGTSSDAARVRSVSGWALAVDGELAGAVSLGGGVSAVAAIDALATTRPLVLRIADTDTDPIARPGLLIGARLQAQF